MLRCFHHAKPSREDAPVSFRFSLFYENAVLAIMGCLQVLLMRYHHVRNGATVTSSVPCVSPTLSSSSPLLRLALSTVAACIPSSLTPVCTLPTNTVDVVRTRTHRLALLPGSWQWQRRRRRRMEREAGSRGDGVDVSGGCGGIRRASPSPSLPFISPTAAATNIGCSAHTRLRSAALRSGGLPSVFFVSHRGCHSDASTGPTSPSLSSPASNTLSTEEANTTSPLLDSLLRRLDGASSADQHSTDEHGKSASQPGTDAKSRSADPLNGRMKTTYVPLLFRPDFIESVAQRRRQVTAAVPSSGLARVIPPAYTQVSGSVSRSTLIAASAEQPLVTPSSSPTVKYAPQPATSLNVEKATVTPEEEQHLGSRGGALHDPCTVLRRETAMEMKESVGPASSLDVNTLELDAVTSNGNDDAASTAVRRSTHGKQEALNDLLDDDEVAADEEVRATTTITIPTAAAAVAASIPRPRRASRLILDPIEWLAQDVDAPLMDDATLRANTSVTDQLAEAVHTTNDAIIATEETITSAGTPPPSSSSSTAVTAAATAVGVQDEEPAAQTRDDEESEAALLADLLCDVPWQQQQRRRRTSKQSAKAASDSPAEAAAADPSPSSPSSTEVPTTLEPDTLVYNVFTRRVAKASSSSIRLLSLLGIHVQPETRELAVTDPTALQSLAVELRAGRVSWPQLWSHGTLYRQLERLLSDSTVTDTASRVADLLRLQYNKSNRQRQRPGLVAGDGSTPADDAMTAAPMAESVHDKLLTLQDLNAEQQAVVELVMKGHHTYIGGGAGTGKSVLLRVLKQQLLRDGLAVAVTGTTGIAGTQIGGCTLHHCLGINVSGEFTRRKDLCSYDVIIIDEVSMLSRELFESLEVHLRRANSPHLPFGGVQMVLCGDFLQLGAIDARPLITSPLFRRYFVQLKLRTVVRHNANARFAAQLQQLRQGQVPADLGDTVRLVSPQALQREHAAAVALNARQRAQLTALAPLMLGEAEEPASPTDPAVISAAVAAPAACLSDKERGKAHQGDGREEGDADLTTTTTNPASLSPFVHGAVNLLPTNAEVNLTNAQQLEQLQGERVSYPPQFLPPCLVGSWSSTFILRITEPAKMQMTVLRLEVQRYLGKFYTIGQRASQPQQQQPSPTTVNFSDGEWLLDPHLGERSIVLYPLFADALALRVRLPLTMDREEARQFLLHVAELDRHLASLPLGVRVRDVLPHGDGMHTETDEYVLAQYAARAPLAHALDLKVGARVMLRTNLAPGLVNGSLGTVVGFRRLVLEELPRYLVGNAQREEAMVQYSDFLQYEQGFQVPIVPIVDFNGRQVPIPPMTQYVGGLPNTHFYSMGVVALPLSLAYAFTVHKVQGLTLVGRVHLELSRMWPCEHLLYVAMSRVRNPDQLSVSAFRPELVRTAADCLLFDNSLPPVWEARIAPYMLAATWRRAPSRRKKVLLKKKLEDYVKKQRHRWMKEARKGDIHAEIRLLEEKMLQQRARAAAKAKQHP